MKQCFKCDKSLPLSEFYKNSSMADGHINKCKVCTREDVANHRAKNIEKVREYDRKRASLPHRIKLRARVTEQWRKANREKKVAQQRLYRAVRSGLVMRLPCFICGDERSVAHHPDYSLPLAVAWMCQAHHKQTHALAKTMRADA